MRTCQRRFSCVRRRQSVDASRQPGRTGRASPRARVGSDLSLLAVRVVHHRQHLLVVDGGNWLRRDFAMPEFTPVADQLSQVLRPAD